MPGGLVDKKDQGDARTRRAEIMTAEYSEHFRTVVADVFFILLIGVAGTDKRFPPMVAPVVFLFHSRDKRDISDIEMAVVAVKAEEVALIRLAGPVAQFGLYEVMFERHIVFELPGIVSAPKVKTHFPAQAELESHIRGARSQIEKVTFQWHILSVKRNGYHMQTHEYQHIKESLFYRLSFFIL